MPTEEFVITAAPEEVARVRHAVVDYAAANSVREPPINDVALAVSEAVTNAVVHAYREGESGTITVRVDVDSADREIRITVADSGGGMVPRPDTPGLGLGLPLIAQIAQRFEVTAVPGGGTEIRMCFALPPD